MCELQPPGAVYPAPRQGAVQSERAQQASNSGHVASARARTKAKRERGRQAGRLTAEPHTERASVRAWQGRLRALCSQVDGMQAASWASLHAECSTSPQKACLCHSGGSARALMLLLMQSQPAVSAFVYHGTGLSAQSNGERHCLPHLPRRQTRGRGLRQRHRRLPPCAILRDLEHSNRSAASIGMHHAQILPSLPGLPEPASKRDESDASSPC